MTNQFSEVQSLLQERAECFARLKLIPYEGSPEVKTRESGRYLYMRNRVGSRRTSVYVGMYSDELYALLLKHSKESRALKKQIRNIEKKLAELGYEEGELSADVIRNLDFARANLKATIYDQAVLEGVATSLPQTAEIIENGIVNDMTATDVQKILNLKHAWEFILDKDVIQSNTDYYLLCHIAKLINEGFFAEGGRIRSVPVTIGGTTYMPPIPMEADVKDGIREIINSGEEAIDVAIKLCIQLMRTQVFLDGNKRASIILANQYLIGKAQGLLVIPERHVAEFKRMLVEYYESDDISDISVFLKNNCWRKV